MSSTPIDFSKYATKPAAGQIDFGKYAKQDLGSMADENGISIPTSPSSPGYFQEALDALGRVGKNLASIPALGYHSVVDKPSTPFEQDLSSANPLALPAYRAGKQMIGGTVDALQKGYEARQASRASGEGLAGQTLSTLEQYPLIGPIVQHIEQGGPSKGLLAPPSPQAVGGAVEGAGYAAAPYLAEKGLGLGASLVNKGTTAAGDLISTTAPHEELANALKPSTHIDVVGDAQRALPALKESAADLGQAPKTPQQLKATINRAVDIHEAKVASLADPLKAEVVPDRVIGNGGENAQLASQLKLGSKNVTLGDIRKFISDNNKVLRRNNYYSLDPSAQVSSGLADTANAVAQARDVFYKFLQDRTGVDIQPLRQTEASLIRLQDNASATANEIAQQSAQFRGQSRLKRAATTAKAVASVGTLGNIPVDPMTEFQGRMGKVFGDVQPGAPAAVQMPAGPLPKPTRPPNDLGFSPGNELPPNHGGPDVARPGTPTATRFKGYEGTPGNPSGGPDIVRPSVPPSTRFRGYEGSPSVPVSGPDVVRPPQALSTNFRGYGDLQSSNYTGGPDVDLRPRAGKPKFNPYRMSPPSTPPAVDDIMQAAKEGKLSPGEADRRLKQLGVNIRVQKRGQ